MTSSSWQQPGAGLKDLKTIRQFVGTRLSAYGVSQEIIYDLLLAVTEAVTNIIQHGYQGRSGWVKVEVEKVGKDVHLIMSDRARVFNPTRVPAPDLSIPLELRPVGGLGVHLIRQNVDQILYQAVPGGGNELVLIKKDVLQDR